MPVNRSLLWNFSILLAIFCYQSLAPLEPPHNIFAHYYFKVKQKPDKKICRVQTIDKS